ncbi:MAG: hypothetical protein Rubg2KO_39960 [Rubricoccaceae bacterium]
MLSAVPDAPDADRSFSGRKGAAHSDGLRFHPSGPAPLKRRSFHGIGVFCFYVPVALPQRLTNLIAVLPAQAGIHTAMKLRAGVAWVPACAGMTCIEGLQQNSSLFS